MITATRYHDFSCGHRVAGHESKCALLHGHNYRIHFTLRGELDTVGRVLDFSVIKVICDWLEENWDHRLLIWEQDETVKKMCAGPSHDAYSDGYWLLLNSIVWVPFNPTAENMAKYLLEVVGPELFKSTGTQVIQVVVEETRKCSASASAWPT